MAIAYCEHPLTKEEKQKITKKGFKILDLKFKPEKIEKDDKVFDKTKAKEAK